MHLHQLFHRRDDRATRPPRATPAARRGHRRPPAPGPVYREQRQRQRGRQPPHGQMRKTRIAVPTHPPDTSGGDFDPPPSACPCMVLSSADIKGVIFMKMFNLAALLSLVGICLATSTAWAGNLLVNGDFSGGSFGFTSDYTHVPNGTLTSPERLRCRHQSEHGLYERLRLF